MPELRPCLNTSMRLGSSGMTLARLSICQGWYMHSSYLQARRCVAGTWAAMRLTASILQWCETNTQISRARHEDNVAILYSGTSSPISNDHHHDHRIQTRRWKVLCMRGRKVQTRGHGMRHQARKVRRYRPSTVFVLFLNSW